jgi:hypothetical protein
VNLNQKSVLMRMRMRTWRSSHQAQPSSTSHNP